MSLKNNHLLYRLLPLPLLIAGCSQMPKVPVPTLPGLGPHKIDIQQGNVITPEMIEKLKPGMTRSQVRFVLGTPLLVDLFRTDRWDYVYTMRKRGDLLEQRQLTVFFQDDKMLRFQGDVVTDTVPGAETAAAGKPVAKPVAKPEPVVPVAVKPAPQAPVAVVAPAAPAREPAPEIGKPQLLLAPTTGEPAKPEDAKPAAAAAAKATPPATPVATPDPITVPQLDAPPLPRLVIQPEEPAAPASPFAPAPVAEAPATAKPAEKPPAQPGFLGRMFGSTQAKPAAAAPSTAAPAAVVAPVAPAVAAAPAPVPVPAPAPVAAKTAVKPEATPVAKPAAKPESSERGFFGRLLDAAGKPASPAPPVRFIGERIAEPGSPPAPFVDPEPAAKKP